MMQTKTYLRSFAAAAILFAVSGVVSAEEAPALTPADTAELAASYSKLENHLRGIDRTEFEPQAIVETVGRSPEKLADWVRTRTRLLPYRGMLRGATGVLMDRAGNSLDRSLLLAEVVQSCGFEVRLANAKLDDSQIDAAWKLTLTAAADERPDASSDAAKAARDTVRRHTADLLKALGPVAEDDAEAARRRAALADHWWVQRREGDNWVDMDVTSIAPKALRTIAFKGSGNVALPPEDMQFVKFRVVMEAFRDGKLGAETVFELPVHPANLLGKSVNFTHFVGDPLKPEDLANDPAALARFKAAMVKLESYVPTLFVDERSLIEAGFNIFGDVEREPQMDRLGRFGSSTGGGFGALVGEAGDENRGVLTAEWIEYDIIVPGEPVQTVRREVFDCIGPAARAAGLKEAPKLTDDQKYARALRMLSNTQILIQPCSMSSAFMVYNNTRREVKNKDLVLTVGQTGRQIQEQIDEIGARLKATDDVTPTIALIRAGAAPAGSRTFIDRPNVIHHTRWFKENEERQRVSYSAIDLAYLSTAALPGEKNAFAARLEQGVADTLAETLVLGQDASDLNTIQQIDAAVKKGSPAVTVKTGDVDALAKLPMPADAKARAQADLAAGHSLVVASGETDRWTWWRVNPRTGQTVGVMDTGYNQAFSEKEIQEEIIAYNRCLNVKMDPKLLREASPEQIAAWAKNHPGTIDNLTLIQTDLRIHFGKMLATLARSAR